jgi:hypothetical protein
MSLHSLGDLVTPRLRTLHKINCDISNNCIISSTVTVMDFLLFHIWNPSMKIDRA